MSDASDLSDEPEAVVNGLVLAVAEEALLEKTS
jgi:hypothetical protein